MKKHIFRGLSDAVYLQKMVITHLYSFVHSILFNVIHYTYVNTLEYK